MKTTMAAALACLVVLLSGCAGGNRGIEPQVSSEADCKAAIDQQRCKLANSLAGGPPISLAGQ